MPEPNLPLLRALLYVVQFERDPAAAAGHAISSVVRAGALGATGEKYLAAVRAGLASELAISQLIPQDHDEPTVRAFLSEVERQLASGTAPPSSP